ncbi:hypothetical protein PIB30_018138 [Stylosanthes scabra]|uniref:Uncharacterized protein n=1 Tax=Stylosanthes scabra TaxID=79078 RepID=A0ABU6Q9B0_9FABA|nr:hypothetical protein [Stylosanthes scabra]
MEEKRETDENGKAVVPISENDLYSWVKGEVREIVSLFTDTESIEALGDPCSWVRRGENVRGCTRPGPTRRPGPGPIRSGLILARLHYGPVRLEVSLNDPVEFLSRARVKDRVIRPGPVEPAYM